MSTKFQDVRQDDVLRVLAYIRNAMESRVSVADAEADSLDRLREFIELFHIAPANEVELMGELRACPSLVCLVGSRGSGKTTALTRFLAQLRGSRTGFVVVDFNRESEELGLDTTGAIDEDKLREVVKLHIRSKIRGRYLSSRRAQSRLDRWVRSSLVNAMTKGGADEMTRFFQRWEYDLQQMMLESPTPVDQDDDAAVERFLMDREYVPLATFLNKAVKPELMSRHYINFLVEEREQDGFYIVFDNVDEVANNRQPILLGLLQSICDGAAPHAKGVISIREENAYAISRKSSSANRSIMRMQAISPDGKRKEVDVEGFELPPLKETLASRALRQRLDVGAASARHDRTIPAAAVDFVEALSRPLIEETYLQEQCFNIVNRSIRGYIETHSQFLEHAARNDFVWLRQIAASSLADRTANLTSLFYGWLAGARQESRPMYVYTLADLYKRHHASEVSCFVEHLVLSYMRNVQAERAANGHRWHFLTIGETITAVGRLGFTQAEVMHAIWNLYWNGRHDGHLIELRPKGMHRPTSLSDLAPEDELWTTPRGDECVASLTYKFHFVLEGVCALRKPHVDSRSLSNEERASLVITFAREIVNYHAQGLSTIRKHIQRENQSRLDWEIDYKDKFGVAVGTDRKYQAERLLENTHRFLGEIGLASLQWRIDELAKRFSDSLVRIRRGAEPLVLDRTMHADLPMEFLDVFAGDIR